MKKYVLLILCCFTSLSAEKLFFGIGGIYGTGLTLKSEGNFTIQNQANYSERADFVGVEGVFGEERYFADIMGYRYYTNFGYGIPTGILKNKLAKTHVGANFDLMVNFLLSENVGFRIYAGVGAELGFLTGSLINAIREARENKEKENSTNRELTYSNLSLHVTANLGGQILLAENHIIEAGVKIPFLNNTTLFRYKTLGQDGAWTLTSPLIVSAKYIFLF